METAKELIELLEDLGYSVSEIVKLSGVSQPSISLIKSGQQSGKTSRQRLKMLLDAAEAQERPLTRSYAPSPGRAIEATVTTIDDIPVAPPTRALQPYTHQASISPQEQDERGFLYRQSRSRYGGITPDDFIRQMQLKAMQDARIEQKLDQLLSQQVREVHRASDNHSYDGAIDLVSAISLIATPFIEDFYTRRQQKLLPPPAEREPQPRATRAYRRQPEPQPQPVVPPSYHITPRLQPTRPAMFGRSAFEQRAHEPQPRKSLWQKIKENW